MKGEQMANGVIRVGFLTYGLDRPLNGISRYTLQLGKHLAEQEGVEVIFFAPYRKGPFVGERGYRSHYIPASTLLPNLMTVGSIMIARAAAQLKLDIFHDPTGVCPFLPRRLSGRFRRVITIHDTIAFQYPQGYNLFNNFLNRVYMPLMLRFADKVITDSRNSGENIVRHLKVQRSNVHPIYLGVEERFRPVAADDQVRVLAKYKISQPYILYVGALEARKNVDGLIRAFARVRDKFPDVALVIGGRPTWKHEHILKAAAAVGGNAINFIGFVDDADLPPLYSSASLFVFVSFYEGFGLPVLEAMACGAPVVCARAGALPEVADSAALIVDPSSDEDIARAMTLILSNPQLRAELRERGERRAQSFSWQHTAQQTLEVYLKTLRT